jgi:hypothetical protein
VRAPAALRRCCLPLTLALSHVLPERLAHKIRAFFNAVIADAEGSEVASEAAPASVASASEDVAADAAAPPPHACCPPAAAFDAEYADADAFPSPGRLVYPYHESDPKLLAQSLRDAGALLLPRYPSLSALTRIREGIKGSWILPYAHKAGVAAPLNDAILSVCTALRSHGQSPIAGLTAHPDDGADAVGAYTRRAIAAGARVAKLHCSVGEYSVLHPGLAPFWETVAAARVPVVVHAGSHVSGNTASPEMRDIEEVARRYPEARVVIAHSGSPAVKAALEVARRCGNVYLDTTPTGEPLPLVLALHADEQEG